MSKEDDDKFCANCVMHDWKQPEDKSLLKPCCKVTSFNCRKILYCERACRKEHWEKVHKNHCQFLADPSKCPQSQHDADTCAICRPPAGTGKGKRGMAGRGNKRNPASSSYVCINKDMHFHPSLTSPHPFPVVGVGNDLMEKAIVVMQNIVHTLIQNPRVAMTCSAELEKVEELLWSQRSQIWRERKIFANPQNYSIELDSLGDLLRSIKAKVGQGKAGKDAEELSKINLVVYTIFLGIDLYRLLQALKNPIDSMPEQFRDIVKRGLDNKVEFIDIAGNIIDSLLTRAIPYEDIVKKLCGGKKRQKCSFCRVQIEVTEYFFVVKKKCSSVLFDVLSIKKFTCDSQDCHMKADTKKEDLYKLSLAVSGAFHERQGTCCDFCFQRCPPGDEHRCIYCFTVTYCSKDCYLEDREEHKAYCIENDRKTKGDRSMRRQLGEITPGKMASLAAGTELENRQDLQNLALEAFQFEDKTKKRAGDNPGNECEHDISIPAAATAPTAEDNRRKSGMEAANTEKASEAGATADSEHTHDRRTSGVGATADSEHTHDRRTSGVGGTGSPFHTNMSDHDSSNEDDVDFKPALDVKDLPLAVQKRVKALKNVQMENVKLEEKYHQEIHALDIKYQKLYDVNNLKRSKIVTGEYEPSAVECEWKTDDEDEIAEDMDKLKINQQADNVGGISNFWLTAFQNANETILGGLVEQTDYKVLEHLTDITVALSEPTNTGFTLNFHFKQNPFFTNQVLTKEYVMRASPDPEDPFDFDGPEIIKCKGCKIEWNKGKNVTRKSVKQKEKPKGKAGKGAVKTVVKLVKADSFFNFFNPPEIPDDPKADVDDEDRGTLVLDFDVGFSIKEKLIPRAVLYFTGEGMTEDDDEFEDEDTEDED